jgi:hypothetical protein
MRTKLAVEEGRRRRGRRRDKRRGRRRRNMGSRRTTMEMIMMSVVDIKASQALMAGEAIFLDAPHATARFTTPQQPRSELTPSGE